MGKAKPKRPKIGVPGITKKKKKKEEEAKLSPAPSAAKTDEGAKRRSVAEARSRGRRASVLSNISEDEARLAGATRPQAERLGKVLFGG